MTAVLDIALVVWLLALALHMASARDDQNAIVGFVAFGFLLALGWLRLASVDVALTEAAIGSGVTGLLLLRAEAHIRNRPMASKQPSRAMTAAVALLSAMIAAALAAVVLLAPYPAPTLASAAAFSLPTTGLGNPVTAVLLAYRALDTLLETVVLLLALVGIWSLSPDRFWGGAPDACPAVVPEPLIFLARALPPIGLLVAIYLFWVGADEPGGAFQGGTVMAAMWILVMLTGLRPAPEIRGTALRWLLVLGSVVFLAVGFLGMATAGSFLAYPAGLAKPFILAIEAALTLSIAVTLGMLVAGPPEKAPGR